MTFRCLLHTFVLSLALTPAGRADDWPQFRGPRRDDVSAEKGLLKTWPEQGPPLVWRATGLGGGYSSVSVAGDRIYTLGNKGNITYLVALTRDGGKVLWTAEVGRFGGDLGLSLIHI